MPRFATLGEYQNSKIQQHVPSPPAFRASSPHYRRTLWLHAKKNFFYRNDPSKAAVLCKQLIERFALTEEAEDAKLLLHDIRIENRGLMGEPQGRMPLGSERVIVSQLAASVQVEVDETCGTKLPIAIALVGLPILGIARGDIIGIGLPETLAFAFMHGMLWTGSRIRRFLHRLVKAA